MSPSDPLQNPHDHKFEMSRKDSILSLVTNVLSDEKEPKVSFVSLAFHIDTHCSVF